MKTVVVGAGIGGLAAALGLIRSGAQVEVYERGDRLRTGGNGVILWPGATGILSELGVDTKEFGKPMHRGELLTQDGTLLVWTDMRQVGEAYGHDTLLVPRGGVVERLGAALPEGTVRFGSHCTGVRPVPSGGALVSFADGSEVHADVVIGADGFRSALRRTLHPGSVARYTGVATWHGITPPPPGPLTALADSHTVRTYFGRLGIFVVHSVGDGLLHWAFEGPWRPPTADDGTAEAPRTPQIPLLRRWFGDWDPAAAAVLDAVDEDDVHVFPHALHDVLRQWGRGPLTLMGDAAHAIPPRAGMGANQALEDAWVLSHALTDGRHDPEAALRGYEAARVRRVRRVAGSARWMSRSNNMLLMLRLIRRAVPMNKLTHANVRGSSNYLNGHRFTPAGP
uniref:FAD-dependent monooxygenase n=1 Tax=Streptomyces violaceoruber TaxID=1935 RepID=C0Z476_STRVN|nr:FAD-dependent monooxygenase [Streptomyces violaceoruber]